VTVALVTLVTLVDPADVTWTAQPLANVKRPHIPGLS
jgi:hypothetical protein